jgi:glycosyltransferase involved in cell wall biosynthesis
MIKSGQLLGLLHRQLMGFQPEGQHHLGFQTGGTNRHRDLSWHLNKLHELRWKTQNLANSENKDDARWLSDRSERIEERLIQLDQRLSEASLPRLVIHGDYGIHNMLFHQDGSATVHDFELARTEWRLIDLAAALTRMDDSRGRLFLAAYHDEYPLDPEEWNLLPQVWQQYRLRGAIQYWDNFFKLGDGYRLKAARKRILQAEQILVNRKKLWQLSVQSEQHPISRTPQVIMVVRLFHPWIGGTERQAHKLAQMLLEKGIPVEVLTGWWFRGTPQFETIDGVPVYRNFTFWEFLGIKGLRKFGGYLYILTLLWQLWRRRDEYDIIHVHGLNYHTFTAVIAGRLFKKKVIAKLANSARASDIEKMRQDKQLALAKYMLPTALKSDRFIALNKAVKEELRAVGVSPHKIVSLPNGVETNSISQKRNYELHQPARLIFVGRLHPQKGLDTLMKAITQLRVNFDIENIQLQLVGDGPIRDVLKDQADELGILSQVGFLGESDQVDKFLQGSDIFVLPSRAEGISNALLEAMACGLPVLVSDIPGNRDVVENDFNGLRFTVDNPHSLAQNIFLLLNDMDLRRRLGQEARATVENRYSLDFVAEKYMDLYQELIKTDRVKSASLLGVESSRIQHDEA